MRVVLCVTATAALTKFGGYSTSALAGRLFDSEASILVIGGRLSGCWMLCMATFVR